ncbi:MAG TPA: ZIP family metal transporter [Candidatus Hydrogenedens sp.]|nr:ZIP family metal transporter [Candidatus Hydrogenedens sp.]
MSELHPAILALLATLFTWFMTLLGALPALWAKPIPQKILDATLGMAAGVMIAVSFWSLLEPSIGMSKEMGLPPWLPAVVGFLLGGVALWAMDKILPHLHQGLSIENAEGIHTNWRRSTLLVMAITMHNIPEGLAVGVAFGATAYGIPGASLTGAIALAISIGLQNLPEGTAVALPLRREGLSPWKSFFIGQLSGIVEPIAGVIGALAVIIARPVLPFALAFAAGAMIFVVAEELIPEAQKEGDTDLPTVGVMFGFALMMFLDVALG